MLQLETLKQIRETALETCKRKEVLTGDCNYRDELSYELCAAMDNIIMYADFRSEKLNDLYDLKAAIVQNFSCMKQQNFHLSKLYKMMVKQYKADIMITNIDAETLDLLEGIRKLLA